MEGKNPLTLDPVALCTLESLGPNKDNLNYCVLSLSFFHAENMPDMCHILAFLSYIKTLGYLKSREHLLKVGKDSKR